MESQEQTLIEVHFYATPYKTLVQLMDWRGILLKRHVNWLGQTRTHCSLRVLIGGIDSTYQATWDGLMMSPTDSIRYQPVDVIDVTNHINHSLLMDNIKHLYKYDRHKRIKLSTMLQLMKWEYNEVTDMTCTSFIADCMGIISLKPHLLYPDNFHNALKEWINV